MNTNKPWALILGASSGFGESIALECSKRGMNIFGVHLDRKSTLPKVEEIKIKIQNNGQKAVFFNINASDEEKRKEVILQIKDTLQNENTKLKLLVHSLAFGTLKPFISDNPANGISKAQVEMTLDVMAHSLVYWTQDIVKYQLMAKNGFIFAMTSAGSQKVWPSYGAVSMAKSALECAVRQLALELAPFNISVNAIKAGVTDTPALRKIPGNEQMIEMTLRKNPFKRLTLPSDISDFIGTVVNLKTPWLTGNVITLDGAENIVD